jgi:chromosome partitioning protein
VGIENNDRENSIYKLLNDRNNWQHYVKQTKIENLDIICANVELSGFETEVAENKNRAFILKEILGALKEKNQYNQILIDCPPSLSLLTVMALVASDSVIVPLQAEFFALEGLTQLLKTINRIKSSLNTGLQVEGIILTMFDKRNKLCSQVEDEARKYFSEQVYSTMIPRNIRISEAPSHGLPVLIYDKKCAGSIAYEKLAKEILEKQKNFNYTA